MSFNLAYIAGPIIGAVIGYCTNYIAVKMLFYPRKEVKVFGHRLPFTPGVIPKGKDRLAMAIGDIVGKRLITVEDIENSLLNDDTKNKISAKISDTIKGSIKDEIKSLCDMSEGDYRLNKENLVNNLTLTIADTARSMELQDFMIRCGGKAIVETLDNPMLSMFLSPELLQSVLGPVTTELQDLLYQDRDELIRPAIEAKLDEIEVQSIDELSNSMDFDIESIVYKSIVTLIGRSAGNLLHNIDIDRIVRDKVNDMSVEELEHIVLLVMKKELNAIVNLGALIGLIIGLLTIFI